jgi:hypothetical protein
MMGDYEGVLDYGAEDLNYLRTLAFIMLGRTGEALASIHAVDTSTPNILGFYLRSLEALIENDVEGSLAQIRHVVSIHDPEGRFYGARHVAHLGDYPLALRVLASAVDDGFFCLPAFMKDPWLDGLRGMPEFADIVKRAEMRHRHALISFLTSEGDRVLGIVQPV